MALGVGLESLLADQADVLRLAVDAVLAASVAAVLVDVVVEASQAGRASSLGGALLAASSTGEARLFFQVPGVFALGAHDVAVDVAHVRLAVLDVLVTEARSSKQQDCQHRCQRFCPVSRHL